MSSSMSKLLGVAVIALGLLVLRPEVSDGSCYQCDEYQENCWAGFEIGWDTCTDIDGDCVLGTVPCRQHAAVPVRTDSLLLADGAIVRGTALSDDSFVVQNCTGDRIVTLYTTEGIRQRSEMAAAIVFDVD